MPTILTSHTDPRWVAIAVAGFDRVLVDHAHCEKKAAASAMALVSAYPEDDVLVARMVRLATEELRHFRQVHDRIVARGLSLGRDEGDPYAKALLALQRTGQKERRGRRHVRRGTDDDLLVFGNVGVHPDAIRDEFLALGPRVHPAHLAGALDGDGPALGRPRPQRPALIALDEVGFEVADGLVPLLHASGEVGGCSLRLNLNSEGSRQ